MQYQTREPEETYKMGQVFAKQIQDRDVIVFFGGLGAGKTCFIKGMAQGLGVREPVTSPTFSIVNIYGGPLPLYHFDMYRIVDADALYETGFFDFLESPGVCAVEWGENIVSFLPDVYYRIDIARGEDDNERIISITKVGEKE